MRVLLLALMIALLPLRGWVGDVMALELTAQSPAKVQAHAPEHHVATHHGHAGPIAPVAHDAGASHASGDGASCTMCQICHSAALATGLPQLASPRSASAIPPAPPLHYASAERIPGFKPPIS